jgi:hypothetical protein
LQYPIGSAPRTAVLGDWFCQGGSVHVFAGGWCEPAERLKPAVIAASWPQFEELIRRRCASPDRAVIVLAAPGEPLLSTHNRERLWQAFRVPIFEQIVGPRGELLAAECEAHDGLHLAAGVSADDADFLPAGCRIEHTPCACGKTEPRLTLAAPAGSARAAVFFAR